MRIIAGSMKGARLVAPRGARTRPTADRVREAVFSILGDVTGLAVLDLFAGSGAMALEALSRGAASAVMVDDSAAAVKAMRRNVEKMRAGDASIVRRDYLAFLRMAASRGWRYDLIFVDPPYRMHRVIRSELVKWLPQVAGAAGRMVMESSSREGRHLPFEVLVHRTYGDTAVSIYRLPVGEILPKAPDER